MKNKIAKICLFAAFSLLLAFIVRGETQAGTYYVSPGGSSSWANCSNISTPCAVSTALGNAVAGDIVMFMDGTYNAPTSPTYRDLVWNPAHSGTSGNPITFKALNRHQAIIKGTGSTSDSGVYAQPVIGAIGRNYITWDGFYLYARNSSDTADIFVTARIDGSTGCSVINNTFRAGAHNYGGATNNAGVFFQGAHYLIIENNTFFGFIETSNNLNNGAIIGYPTNYVTIKNNTIYDCTGAIFLKDAVSYATVESNFINN
ncbi:MAG: right-handed parallel beta-helix repeat-containing protein, partial [Parcubacteria group bacterium]